MNSYVELRKLADEIPVGTTDAGRVCPFCHGGRNGDRGFSVTRPDEATLLYKCHRASCGRAGRIAAWGHRLAQISDSSDLPSPPEFTPRVYSGDTGRVDARWLSCLLDLFHLQEEDVDRAGWLMDTRTERLICPVRSPGTVLRGHEARHAPWHTDRGAKTRHYQAVDGAWLGWFRGPSDNPTVLVEDLVSACKVSRQFTACSLMGSYLSIDHIEEIVGVSGNVVLALDRDATDKACKFVEEYGLLIPNFRHVQLSKDLKYSTDEEIREIILS